MNRPKHADFTLSDRLHLPLPDVHVDTGPMSLEQAIDWYDRLSDLINRGMAHPDIMRPALDIRAYIVPLVKKVNQEKRK